MSDWQSPEELAAHCGPGGPVYAIESWIRAVFLAGDMRSAWREMDPDFRLALAQLWCWDQRERPDLAARDLEAAAADLAQIDNAHDLWPELSSFLLGEFRQLDLDFESWGFGSRPRPVTPDFEFVYLVHTGTSEVTFIEEPTEMRVHPFLAHHRDGRWWMAGMGPAPLGTGWPPPPPPEVPADWTPPG